jgi:hypothetical protein
VRDGAGCGVAGSMSFTEPPKNEKPAAPRAPQVIDSTLSRPPAQCRVHFRPRSRACRRPAGQRPRRRGNVADPLSDVT